MLLDDWLVKIWFVVSCGSETWLCRETEFWTEVWFTFLRLGAFLADGTDLLWFLLRTELPELNWTEPSGGAPLWGGGGPLWGDGGLSSPGLPPMESLKVPSKCHETVPKKCNISISPFITCLLHDLTLASFMMLHARLCLLGAKPLSTRPKSRHAISSASWIISVNKTSLKQ